MHFFFFFFNLVVKELKVNREKGHGKSRILIGTAGLKSFDVDDLKHGGN